jgi:hypothetical protein
VERFFVTAFRLDDLGAARFAVNGLPEGFLAVGSVAELFFAAVCLAAGFFAGAGARFCVAPINHAPQNNVNKLRRTT